MHRGDFVVRLSYLELIIILLTIGLMLAFTLIITRTSIGRAQRACQQDTLMASLVGINVDRTISITFVMGAALAAVAGTMFALRYGVIDFFIGFLAGIKAFTAAVLGDRLAAGRHVGRPPDRPNRGVLVGLFHHRI